MCLMAAAPTVPSDLRSLPPRAAEAPRNVTIESAAKPPGKESIAHLALVHAVNLRSVLPHLKCKCRAKAHWVVNAWLSLKTSQIQHGQLCGTRHASSATVSFRTGMTRFAPTTGRSVLGPVCSPHKSASRCVAVSRAPPHDTGPAGSTGFSSSLALAPSRIKFPLASPAFIDRTMPDVCQKRPSSTSTNSRRPEFRRPTSRRSKANLSLQRRKSLLSDGRCSSFMTVFTQACETAISSCRSARTARSRRSRCVSHGRTGARLAGLGA